MRLTPVLSALVLAACASRAPRLERASGPNVGRGALATVVDAPKGAVWCTKVPFTDDPSGDKTGIANDEARVEGIASKFRWDIVACPGVTGVGVGLERIEEALAHGAPMAARTGPEDATSTVLRVLVRSEADLPKTNPLYLDGVRVYFTVVEYVPL